MSDIAFGLTRQPMLESRRQLCPPRGQVDVVPKRGDEACGLVDLDHRVALHGVLDIVDYEAIDPFEVPTTVGVGLVDDIPSHLGRRSEDVRQHGPHARRSELRWMGHVLVRRALREARCRRIGVATFDGIEECSDHVTSRHSRKPNEAATRTRTTDKGET